MKEMIQQHLVHILMGACVGAGGAILLAMVVLSATDVEEPSAAEIPVLDAGLLQESPPSMQEILAKHLFVPAREATGQNSFPNLVVKGVYLGTQRNALFSLQSRPDANLRVWADRVSDALDQVIDPKDPRQPIVEFLREWTIQKIDFEGVTVKHFITGEEEVYAVDYTPTKKVKDDALRGYGQGAIPQGSASKTAIASTAKKTSPSSTTAKSGMRSAPAGSASFMADRVSNVMKSMNPQQRQQFMKQLFQKSGGGSSSSSSEKSSSKSSKKSSKKK